MQGDFEIFSESDKRSSAYLLCVMGTTATGATLGSIAGGQTLIGAAGGAVFGLLACRTVDAALKRKLFDPQTRLAPDEFRTLARQTARAFPHMGRAQVIELLGSARASAQRSPGLFRC